ncbi:sugar phosphate isomerase/epimerase family protein [Streptomyces sp. 8L]|uniref:sugar phosphate isomerase/epimerase family protein n=1 Tax=Streptomyces sp. 8L TaxID=2877242 RepID=UPI001CD1FEA9|nr:sugar phosphate isomerase/epimerase [Streptomyces sp. 8L]MCA1222482.1 sugar phosphate isomerase/epimerase [Streptomyces sp. 8L]
MGTDTGEMGTGAGAARIGVMMYTVLEAARADLEGTLERIAALGYAGIETYGLVEHFGPARVRAAIASAGLTLTSAHAPFPAGPGAGEILDRYEELGAEVLVWSMEREEFDTPDAVRRGVERVNEAAEAAAGRGMRIAYHNHFAEFSQVFDGTQAYDLLLDLLDDRVLIELDAYWAVMGGADPAEVVARLGPRVRLLHVKDGPALSYEDDVMVPVGEGRIDWTRTLTVPSGLRWHIVELERLHIDTFEALRRSYDHLVGRGLSRGATAPAPVTPAPDTPAPVTPAPSKERS